MRRHRLHRRAPEGALLDVAAELCGLHAQLMSSAELAAWARLEDLDPGAVGRALWEDRSLVKTWAMRGTLHLLPAAELPLWRRSEPRSTTSSRAGCGPSASRTSSSRR